MPRVKYIDNTGDLVPGTTTVTGAIGDSSGMHRWQLWEAQKGNDPVASLNFHGSVGTLAHALIDAEITGHSAFPTARDLELPNERMDEAMALATNSFNAFKQWREEMSPEFLATEVSLVCDKHRFGGTPDAVAIIDGKLTMVDWKTSGRIYPKHHVQAGAYCHLWGWGRMNINQSTEHPKKIPSLGELPEQYLVLRLDKNGKKQDKAGRLFQRSKQPNKRIFEEIERFKLWRTAYETRV